MNRTLHTPDTALHPTLLNNSLSLLIWKPATTFSTVLGVVKMVKQKRVVTSKILERIECLVVLDWRWLGGLELIRLRLGYKLQTSI